MKYPWIGEHLMADAASHKTCNLNGTGFVIIQAKMFADILLDDPNSHIFRYFPIQLPFPIRLPELSAQIKGDKRHDCIRAEIVRLQKVSCRIW